MKRLAVVLAGLAAATAVLAEEAPARPWTNTTELGLIVTGGNTDSTSLAFGNKYAYRWSNAEFLSNAAALNTESRQKAYFDGTNVVEPPSETTAESYAIDGKYRHTMTGDLFWYALAGWNRNRFQGIDSRLFGGGGIGYRFFEVERSKLTGEFGFDYTQESPVSGEDRDFAGARAFLAYEHKIGASSKFNEDFEVLENLDDTGDLRIKSVTSLTASLTTKVALKVSAVVLYDADPVVEDLDPSVDRPGGEDLLEYDEVDTILTATLVINF